MVMVVMVTYTGATVSVVRTDLTLLLQVAGVLPSSSQLGGLPTNFQFDRSVECNRGGTCLAIDTLSNNSHTSTTTTTAPGLLCLLHHH